MPDVLFAPWRYEYLVSDKSAAACFLCEAASATSPEEDLARLVVYRGRGVFVLLNRYPYTNGHVMVAPYAHAATLAQSDPAVREELINFGSAAGAGLADHYHVHVVPRWKGDTIFMTVTGDVRVVPETPERTLERLRPLFAAGVQR